MNDPRTIADQNPSPALEAGERDLAFPAFQQPSRRTWFRRVAIACASLVFMAALGVASLFLVLSRGPVDLAFLSDRIAVGLEQQMGAGIDVDVGRTVLEKNDDGFALHVLDIVLKEASGREILRSPDAVVTFNPLHLLRLSFVPDRLSLRGMKLRAEITAEGDVLFTSTGASASATTRLSDVVAAVLGIGSPDAGGSWSAIAIADASLDIDDRRNGKRLSFDNMNLAFGSPRDGVLEATGSLRKERDIVRFSVLSEGAEGGRRLRLGFTDVGDHVLQAILGAKAPYLHLAAKLSASADLLIGADGKVKRFGVEASLGGGHVEVESLKPGRLAIDRLRLAAAWDVAQPRRATLDARFEGDGFRLSLAGPLAVPDDGMDTWRWEAAGNGWTLPPLTARDQPVIADKAQVRFDFEPKARRARFTNVLIEGPATRLTLNGDMAAEDEGFGVNASLEATRMPVRTALRWWPSFISAPPRDFLVRTVRDGELSRLTVAVAMPPAVFRKAMQLEALPRESLQVTAQADNAAFELSEGLPLLTGISGQGRLDALEAQGTFHKAQVDGRGGRRLQLAEGLFNLDGLDSWYPGARFRFKATGPLDAVAEVLRSPDLRGAYGADVEPNDVKGKFDGTVALQLPLASTLDASQVVANVEARMTGVSIEKAIGNDRLENAVLTVSTDRTGVEIKGEGRWQGTPVSLTLENDAEAGSRSAVLSMVLDDAAMKRRGFAVQGQVQGPLPVKIRHRVGKRDVARTQVEVDLTRSAIDGLLPGLQKPAGRAGKLSFEAIDKAGGGYTIQNFALDTGPSQVRGQAEATADGTVTSARFSLFRLSPGDNVKLDYDRTGANARVTIRGNNLDARPFLRSASSTDGPRKEGDLELDVKTTLLSGHGSEVLTNAEARIAMRGSQLRQLSVTGRLNGKSVSLSGRGTGEGALPVTVESADAGALLRYFDLYSRMMGGSLSGVISVTPRRSAGYVIAKDFALRNEPAIRRLVAEGQTDSARRGTVDTEFSKMRIDFSRDGTEIAVKDAVIFGAQLGLTFNGMIDPVRDRISLSGTYVPAYGLNNAFAQIPLVGNLLAGSRNEGLLAVTFGVTGRASQPTVSVNPLSAVAPGIFRKIFEFRNDRTGSTPPLSYNPAAN